MMMMNETEIFILHVLTPASSEMVKLASYGKLSRYS